ncbi:hypothetical protein [Erythrobacter sp. THAF29]|uniref:hypothetical protein n=1 Tax=Erythrobacter sp. THAF29 TaxID=2587851 RepID=UPI001267ACC4|nr:hypothetical protein [Erythrobacter sp. THAF29]QFT78576.1 hypothetical protein FIU90_13585 [Erythrobacter sp. THAF29]
MMDPLFVIAATCLVGISVVAFALLRAWQGWLDLKREELDRPSTPGSQGSAPEIEGGAGVGAARIEMADLKERIKKLEAIASGVEL